MPNLFVTAQKVINIIFKDRQHMFLWLWKFFSQNVYEKDQMTCV